MIIIIPLLFFMLSSSLHFNLIQSKLLKIAKPLLSPLTIGVANNFPFLFKANRSHKRDKEKAF